MFNVFPLASDNVQAKRRDDFRLGRCCYRCLTMVVSVAILSITNACASSGVYVWADEAPATFFEPKPNYLVSVGDVVSVRVFGQEPLSVRAPVRADGMLTMPLIGDVAMAGKNPAVLAKEIETRLVPFLNAPSVTVVIDESRTRVVAIGELRRNGSLVLESGETGLLAALANSGGLTEFASGSSIYVIRSAPNGHWRIRFRYEDIIQGVGRAATFQLRSGDQIVVE